LLGVFAHVVMATTRSTCPDGQCGIVTPVITKGTALLQSRKQVAWAPQTQGNTDMQEIGIFSEYLPLCDPAIVQETCQKLGGSTESPSVSWAVLADLLSADSLATVQVLLGFREDQPAVSCNELCTSVVEYVRRSGMMMPDSSDVACRTVQGSTTCDVNVDPADLMDMLGSVDIEELSDDGPQITPKQQSEGGNAHGARPLEISNGRGSSEGLDALLGHANRTHTASTPGTLESLDSLHYSGLEILERFANLFRFYPSIRRDGQASSPEVALLQKQGDIRDRTVEGLIATRATQAKAWLATILREMAGRRTAGFRNTWFGGSGSKTAEQVRQRVLRTMNFIEEEMVEGLRFIYPANDARDNICRGNIGAYVWTRGGSEDKGYEETPAEGIFLCGSSADPFTGYCGVDQDNRYFVYLCRAWYEVASPSSQVSLLIHEAAHHAGPKDVTYDKGQMKSNNQANQLNNAANYQNFALDISKSVQLVEPRTSRPPTPSSGCSDLNGSCDYYRKKGFCSSSEHIRKNCRKTCGVCGPAPAPAPSASCSNIDGACDYYRKQGFCSSSDHIRKNCRKSCGVC